MEGNLSSRIHAPERVIISDPAAPFAPDAKAQIAEPMGAVSDAALLAFQLPEAPEDMESDLDQESQAWLRIRRASKVLLQAPQSPPKFPAKPWIREGRPPTVKELQILNDFSDFCSSHGLPLEVVWERLACKTGNVSFTSLRNNLGYIGAKEETVIQTNGTLWPSALASPEQIHAAITALLRINNEDHKAHDNGLPKDKFILLRKWMDKEASINNILDAHEVDQTMLAEASGAKLHKIMKLVAHHPKKITSVEDILKFVQIMLELEPRATTSFLLFESSEEEKHVAIVLDMIFRQGLPCIENKSLLTLMSFCSNLLDQLIQLGSPTCPLTFKEQMMASSSLGSLAPQQRMADIPPVRKELNKSLVRRQSMGTLSPVHSRPSTPKQNPAEKSELPGLELAKVTRTSPPTSTRTPKGSTKLPSLTDSPANSGRDKMDKFAFYLDSSVKSDDSVNCSKHGLDIKGSSADEAKSLVRSKSSAQANDETPSNEDQPLRRKNVRRNSSLPNLPKRDAQIKRRVVAELPDDVDGSTAMQNFGSTRPENPKTSGGSLNTGGRRNGHRRATVNLGRRRSIDAEPGSLAAAATALNRMTDAEWEFSSGQLFWSTMPPQTITYAIGASLQPVGSRKLGTEMILPAWRLLDKANAVDCIVGKVGIKRLRLEMACLLDLFNRTLQIDKGEDTEEPAVLVDKIKLTMKHLESICGAESKLAQVAVLYGVTFIAEVLCIWAGQREGGGELATATRDLSRALSPHFQQLFQRRLDSP